MSDPRQLAHAPLGIVDHINFLSEDFGRLCVECDLTDVVLKVGNQSFNAHKVLLAARSDFFKALFFGGMKESNEETIELKDINPTPFQHFLKYIYTGKMNLSEMNEELLLEVLGLANRFVFKELIDAVSEFLKAILDNRNVCNIYDAACLYSLDELCDKCCTFIDQNAMDIMNCDSFLQISKEALRDLLSRDSFCAEEIDIFRAVKRWREHNSADDVTEITSNLRLSLLEQKALLNEVRDSGFVSPETILDSLNEKGSKRNMQLPYRGFRLMDENVATTAHGTLVVHGEMKASLLDGDNQHYDLDRGFTRHPIDEKPLTGIVVKLGKPFIINQVRMLLWDRDMRSYSYRIQVSMDDEDYEEIVDHSKYLCRSWQNLHFKPVVVRYIRVLGTHNTVNRIFHLVSFECMYSRHQAKLTDSIIVPSENVATMEASACVVEGVSRSRNALINGDNLHYDWDSGYTCHQLGSGQILVQLPQPFIIGSLRLLLWDCDNRSYSYFIQVSTDNVKYMTVVDKTAEKCRSWQTVVFDPQVVVFIKIVGTHNTANEVFHCVHFECPADKTALQEYHTREAALSASNSASSSASPVVPAHIPASRSSTWPAAEQSAASFPVEPHRNASAEQFLMNNQPRHFQNNSHT